MFFPKIFQLLILLVALFQAQAMQLETAELQQIAENYKTVIKNARQTYFPKLSEEEFQQTWLGTFKTIFDRKFEGLMILNNVVIQIIESGEPSNTPQWQGDKDKSSKFPSDAALEIFKERFRMICKHSKETLQKYKDECFGQEHTNLLNILNGKIEQSIAADLTKLANDYRIDNVNKMIGSLRTAASMINLSSTKRLKDVLTQLKFVHDSRHGKSLVLYKSMNTELEKTFSALIAPKIEKFVSVKKSMAEDLGNLTLIGKSFISEMATIFPTEFLNDSIVSPSVDDFKILRIERRKNLFAHDKLAQQYLDKIQIIIATGVALKSKLSLQQYILKPFDVAKIKPLNKQAEIKVPPQPLIDTYDKFRNDFRKSFKDLYTYAIEFIRSKDLKKVFRGIRNLHGKSDLKITNAKIENLEKIQKNLQSIIEHISDNIETINIQDIRDNFHKIQNQIAEVKDEAVDQVIFKMNQIIQSNTESIYHQQFSVLATAFDSIFECKKITFDYFDERKVFVGCMEKLLGFKISTQRISAVTRDTDSDKDKKFELFNFVYLEQDEINRVIDDLLKHCNGNRPTYIILNATKTLIKLFYDIIKFMTDMTVPFRDNDEPNAIDQSNENAKWIQKHKIVIYAKLQTHLRQLINIADCSIHAELLFLMQLIHKDNLPKFTQTEAEEFEHVSDMDEFLNVISLMWPPFVALKSFNTILESFPDHHKIPDAQMGELKESYELFVQAIKMKGASDVKNIIDSGKNQLQEIIDMIRKVVLKQFDTKNISIEFIDDWIGMLPLAGKMQGDDDDDDEEEENMNFVAPEVPMIRAPTLRKTRGRTVSIQEPSDRSRSSAPQSNLNARGQSKGKERDSKYLRVSRTILRTPSISGLFHNKRQDETSKQSKRSKRVYLRKFVASMTSKQ